jgi:hypothetical protein
MSLYKYVCIAILLLSNVSYASNDDLNNIYEEAKAGSKSALYNLGVKFSNGDGVKKNQELALMFYEESALKNYAPAQNNLGWAYRHGLSVKKDPSLAVYWFRLSALQNNALALQNLAEMYQSGEGVAKNTETAESLYTLCASQPALDKLDGREDGFNNAILECRKELGKLISLRAKDDQTGLKYAVFWFRTSLVDIDDLKTDSEIGVRARRTEKDTLATLKTLTNKLSPESVQWIEETLKNWGEVREIIQDRTGFPLTVLDYLSDDPKL